jgi:exosortase B
VSSVLPARTALGEARAILGAHWPVLAGLLLLYAPTYLTLAREAWPTEEQGHGPIILAVVLYLVWRERERLAALPCAPREVAGAALLGCGLLLYVLGRSQDILFFEVGSQIPVICGVLLLFAGPAALRILWFPILYLAFLVPLPGIVIDALTLPLKHVVSAIVETLLYAAGYPIARGGVVLTIGQYQLLVADACSGLNSIFSLAALGLLYIYIVRHPGWWRNALLLASILPVAFAANIIRVVVLVLVTYHLGDEAGQGFVHGFAGMLLFIAALTLFLGLDALIGLTAARVSRRVAK